jgi:hypothetical protein
MEPSEDRLNCERNAWGSIMMPTETRFGPLARVCAGPLPESAAGRAAGPQLVMRKIPINVRPPSHRNDFILELRSYTPATTGRRSKAET